LLTVVTYNVHRCIGRDGQRDAGRVYRVLQQLRADIAGLQEVESAGTDGNRQLLAMAEQDGFYVVTGPTLTRSDSRYGNALLLRMPPRQVHRHDLSVPGREPRGALEARIVVGDTPVRIIVTHLGLRADERRRQFAALGAILAGQRDAPTVLMGDFNEWWPRARSLGKVARALSHGPSLRTFPARRPMLALDRIWASSHLQQHALMVHRSPEAALASDHLPLKAVLELL